jgi:hypothetical protein
MKTETIKSILSTGIPVLFTGAAGVGKTEKVRSCFDYVETLLLSAESEENIGGLPWRDGNYDYRTTPAMFRRLNDAAETGKTTALFLDEIDKADRAVADTLLTLVASRQINGNRLPDGCAIVAAANPPEYGGGDGLSTPMLNRFTVVDFNPVLSEWGSWALKHFKTERAAAVVSTVLSGSFPLVESAGEGLETRTTSPRSLAMALKIIESDFDEETTEILLRGLLTPNAATKIMAALDFEKPYGDTLKQAVDVLGKGQVIKSGTKKPRKPLEV